MRAGTRLKTKTRTVTTKVAPQEEALLKQRAEQEGLTLSEWVRQALLASARASSDTRIVLAEFMALRTVFARLYADSLQGNPPSDARLQAVLQHAEQTKFQLAEDRIEKTFARSLKSAPEPAA